MPILNAPVSSPGSQRLRVVASSQQQLLDVYRISRGVRVASRARCMHDAIAASPLHPRNPPAGSGQIRILETAVSAPSGRGAGGCKRCTRLRVLMSRPWQAHEDRHILVDLKVCDGMAFIRWLSRSLLSDFGTGCDRPPLSPSQECAHHEEPVLAPSSSTDRAPSRRCKITSIHSIANSFAAVTCCCYANNCVCKRLKDSIT